MKVEHTPLPWRKSNRSSDAIVSDDLAGVSPVEIEDYGGRFICEGMRGSDRDITILAVNHHQELVTRLYTLCNAIERDFPLTCNQITEYVDARETLKKVIQ